jgi:hypothetical protein
MVEIIPLAQPALRGNVNPAGFPDSIVESMNWQYGESFVRLTGKMLISPDLSSTSRSRIGVIVRQIS